MPQLYRTMPLNDIARMDEWDRACYDLGDPKSTMTLRLNQKDGTRHKVSKPAGRLQILMNMKEGLVSNGYRGSEDNGYWMPISLRMNFLPYVAFLYRHTEYDERQARELQRQVSLQLEPETQKRRPDDRSTVAPIGPRNCILLKREVVCRTMTWRLDMPGYTSPKPITPRSILCNIIHNCWAPLQWQTLLLPGCVNRIFIRASSPVNLGSMSDALKNIGWKHYDMWARFKNAWRGYELKDTSFEFYIPKYTRDRTDADQTQNDLKDWRVRKDLIIQMFQWNWKYDNGEPVQVGIYCEDQAPDCPCCGKSYKEGSNGLSAKVEPMTQNGQ
jgi:hypothetical protein